MNRQIAFRGKSTLETENKWYHGSLVITENGNHVIRYESSNVVNYVPVDPETVGQLFHVNMFGAIYEGDIVEDVETKAQYEIYWNNKIRGFSINFLDLEEVRLNIENFKVISDVFVPQNISPNVVVKRTQSDGGIDFNIVVGK
jgi:hypothetical protein